MSGTSFPTNLLQWLYLAVSSATVVRLWDGRPNVWGGALSVTGFLLITLLGVAWIFLREFFSAIINILNWLMALAGIASRIPAFQYWLRIYENLDQITFIALLVFCLCVAVAMRLYLTTTRLVFVGKPLPPAPKGIFKGSLPSSPTQPLAGPQAPISAGNSPLHGPFTPTAAAAAEAFKIPVRRPDSILVRAGVISPLILSPTSWIAEYLVNPIVDKMSTHVYKMCDETLGSPLPVASGPPNVDEEHTYTSSESDDPGPHHIPRHVRGTKRIITGTPRLIRNSDLKNKRAITRGPGGSNPADGPIEPVEPAGPIGIIGSFVLFVSTMGLIWFILWSLSESIVLNPDSSSVSPTFVVPSTFHVVWPQTMTPIGTEADFGITVPGSEEKSSVDVKKPANAASFGFPPPTSFNGKSTDKISKVSTSSKRTRVPWGRKTSKISEAPSSSEKKASFDNTPISELVKPSEEPSLEVRTQSGSKLDVESVRPPIESERNQAQFKIAVPTAWWNSVWGTAKKASLVETASAEKTSEPTTSSEALPSSQSATFETVSSEQPTSEERSSELASSKSVASKLAELLSSKAAASKESAEEKVTFGPSISKATTTYKKYSAAEKKASSLPSTSKAISKQSTSEKEATIETTSDIKSVGTSSAAQTSDSEAATSPLAATTQVTSEYNEYVDTYQPFWDRWLWPNSDTKSRSAEASSAAQVSQYESATAPSATTQSAWWNEDHVDTYEPFFHQHVKLAWASIKGVFFGPNYGAPCSKADKGSCATFAFVNITSVAALFFLAVVTHYVIQVVRGVAPTSFGVLSSILIYQPVFWGIIFSLGRFMPYPFGDIVSAIQYHWQHNRLFVYFVILASIKASKGFVHIISFYFYTRPAKSLLSPTVTPDDVTVIVPSIGDFGEDFQVTIKSILANKPRHLVIATVDAERVSRLKINCLNTLPREMIGNTKITIDMTMVGNKRSQFLSAATQAETSIVCYADDHVMWPSTFLKSALAPFEDPHTGMVGTVKAVERVRNKGAWVSFLNYIGCIYLERHNFECTATYNIDGGVFVISGRTGLVRREILANLNFRTGILNEYFKFGPLKAADAMKPDDDNYMTRYCVRNGWKTVFHNDPLACIGTSIGVDTQDGSVTKKFYNQLVRWARTTWRSNLVSLFHDRVCWRVHPWTTYAMLISSFINLAVIYDPLMLLSLYFSSPSTSKHFCGAILLLFLSKCVKPLQHLFREPKDIIWFLPGILFGYGHSVIRLIALCTMTDVGWGGRTFTPSPAAAP